MARRRVVPPTSSPLQPSFIYLFRSLHACSSQVDDVIAGPVTRHISGVIKPEVGSDVEVRRGCATWVTAETGGHRRVLVKCRRRRWATQKDRVTDDHTACATVRRRHGGEMTTLGVSGLTTPLDASVLKPDFDLRLDETKLGRQIAPADHTDTCWEIETWNYNARQLKISCCWYVVDDCVCVWVVIYLSI